MSHKIKTTAKWVIIYPMVVFICLELAFRILGYRPFYNDDYSIKTNPVNAYVGDSILGVRLAPGMFDVLINDKISFQATHSINNFRSTPGCNENLTPDFVFMGCSYTYGYGVNDNETFVALLQKEYPDLNFQNNGVIGYGTVQSLIQLKELVKSNELPKAILVNFSSHHLIRNVLSSQYRSNLKIGYNRSNKNVNLSMTKAKFPFKSSCTGEIEFADWNSMYSNWYGRSWSAAINAIQSKVDNAKEPQNSLEVTQCIINEMSSICKQNDIAFGIICLDYTDETHTVFQETILKGDESVEIMFDFTNKKFTNLPYDSHPNFAGHKLIAEGIKPLINKLLDAE